LRGTGSIESVPARTTGFADTVPSLRMASPASDFAETVRDAGLLPGRVESPFREAVTSERIARKGGSKARLS
jgi:hypothetical protein